MEPNPLVAGDPASGASDEAPVLTLLIEQAPMGIVLFDRNMNYVAASRRFLDDFELSPALDTRTIVGKCHYDLFPEIPERWRHIHRQVLAGEPAESEEDSFTRLDGRIDYIRWKMLPWRRSDNSVAGALLFSTVITHDKTAARRTEAELSRAADEFRTLADNIPTLCWMAYADGHIYWYNRRWYEYTGTTPKTQEGWGWESVHDPKALPEVTRRWKRSLETGEPFEMTFPLKGADGFFRRFLTRIIPVRDKEGTIVRWFGANTNIEEQKLAEEREHLLAREVDHRAKNMLAVVQSMVRLSRGDSIDAYRDSIINRIHALSLAHNLLAAERWQGVELHELIREEVAPYAGANPARISVIGPRLILQPAGAQTFALLLHELTTNSVKHGAFTTGEGRVEISWSGRPARSDSAVIFRWQEFGGPPVVPPKRQGFGLSLLRAGVERQLNGRIALDWAADGLVCHLEVQAKHFVQTSIPAEERSSSSPDSDPVESPAVQRVLIVEDEALVGLEIEAALSRAGLEVLGPATELSEALRLASQANADIALLDINLHGEKSFTVAEVLAARSIPFIFCTGYGTNISLPERFSDTPVVVKPYTVGQLFQAMNRAIRQPVSSGD